MLRSKCSKLRKMSDKSPLLCPSTGLLVWFSCDTLHILLFSRINSGMQTQIKLLSSRLSLGKYICSSALNIFTFRVIHVKTMFP